MASTRSAAHTSALCLAVLTSVLAAEVVPAQGRGGQVYSVSMMGDLRISLPTGAGVDRAMYRDAGNRWMVAPGSVADGVMTVDLSSAEVPGGRTLLMVGAPSGVNLDDSSPPHVVSVTVDGVSFAASEQVELGGVDALPGRVVLRVADDESPLRRSTLRVAANGRVVGTRGAGVEYTALGSRKAEIAIDIPVLLGEGARHNTISVQIDDYALDDEVLNWTLSFSMEPPHVLPDGTVARVDSVTSSAGWAEWWVIFDGQRMNASGGTTAGKTWLSEGNRMPHWLRLDFPEPRAISEVVIAWAYWECYRTSQRYEVQVLRDGRWITVVDAAPEIAQQESRHTFAPVETSAVRLWQPAMMGSAAEPQYLWISEFEVR